MALFAEVNGLRATGVRLTIPPGGVWSADVALDVDTAPPTSVTLGLADLALTGTVVASDAHAGQRTLRILGGGAGWSQTVPGKFYHHAVGLKLSMVLGDVAREVGESVVIASDSLIGEFFVRREGPATRVLRRFAPVWWVRADGKTYVGDRPTGIIKAHVDVIGFDGATGHAVLAAEALAELLPGRTISTPTLGTHVLGEVIHTATANELRSEVTLLEAA